MPQSPYSIKRACTVFMVGRLLQARIGDDEREERLKGLHISCTEHAGIIVRSQQYSTTFETFFRCILVLGAGTPPEMRIRERWQTKHVMVSGAIAVAPGLFITLRPYTVVRVNLSTPLSKTWTAMPNGTYGRWSILLRRNQSN